MQILDYDPDSEKLFTKLSFKNVNLTKKISFNVDPKNAEKIYNRKNVEAKVFFRVIKNSIKIDNVQIEEDDFFSFFDHKGFEDNTKFIAEDLSVEIKNDNVNFDEVQLQNPNLIDKYEVKSVGLKDYKDDLEPLLDNIKQAKIDNNKWLFVIGVEDYDNTDNVLYSKNSTLLFTKTAQKTLGISKRNTYLLMGATSGAIKDKLKLLSKDVKKGDKIYFYYSGHGIPVAAQNNEPYILPKDKVPDFIEEDKFFKLKNIYKTLTDTKASKVVAVVDTCFSGATDDKNIIKGVGATRLKAKDISFNKKKLSIITAGRSKQYSNMFEVKKHRLLSYYVIKSLIKGRREVDSIYKEVSLNVVDASKKMGPLKIQEPPVVGE